MDLQEDNEERTFLQKYGFVLGLTAVGLVIGGLVVGQISKGEQEAPLRPMPEVFMIKPLPPPPPPPPPPKMEPPKEVVEKMIEQTPVDEPEPKPDDSPKAAAPALTTNVAGSGNDGFGLGAGGHGGGLGGGGGGGARSRFGWYAGEVQKAFQEALSRNRSTGDAQFERKARVWADASGRVTRVKLEGPSGDGALDQAITEALTGIQLQDPPPGDMPMPIVMRLIARRPN